MYEKFNLIIEGKTNTVKLPTYLLKEFESVVMGKNKIMKKELTKETIKLIREELQKRVDWDENYAVLVDYKSYEKEGVTFTYKLTQLVFNEINLFNFRETLKMAQKYSWRSAIAKKYIDTYECRTLGYLKNLTEQDLCGDSKGLKSLVERAKLSEVVDILGDIKAGYERAATAVMEEKETEVIIAKVKEYVDILKSYYAEVLKANEVSDVFFEKTLYSDFFIETGDGIMVDKEKVVAFDLEEMKQKISEESLDASFVRILYKNVQDKISEIVSFDKFDTEVILNFKAISPEITKLSKELGWKISKSRLEGTFLIYVLKLEFFEFISIKECKFKKLKDGRLCYLRS